MPSNSKYLKMGILLSILLICIQFAYQAIGDRRRASVDNEEFSFQERLRQTLNVRKTLEPEIPSGPLHPLELHLGNAILAVATEYARTGSFIQAASSLRQQYPEMTVSNRSLKFNDGSGVQIVEPYAKILEVELNSKEVCQYVYSSLRQNPRIDLFSVSSIKSSSTHVSEPCGSFFNLNISFDQPLFSNTEVSGLMTRANILFPLAVSSESSAYSKLAQNQDLIKEYNKLVSMARYVEKKPSDISFISKKYHFAVDPAHQKIYLGGLNYIACKEIQYSAQIQNLNLVGTCNPKKWNTLEFEKIAMGQAPVATTTHL